MTDFVNQSQNQILSRLFFISMKRVSILPSSHKDSSSLTQCWVTSLIERHRPPRSMVVVRSLRSRTYPGKKTSQGSDFLETNVSYVT